MTFGHWFESKSQNLWARVFSKKKKIKNIEKSIKTETVDQSIYAPHILTKNQRKGLGKILYRHCKAFNI